MAEREPHCIISFDKTCPKTCKLYRSAVAAYREAIELIIRLGVSREEAIKFYWDRTPQEKATLEAERAQYLKNQGVFNNCNYAETFKNEASPCTEARGFLQTPEVKARLRREASIRRIASPAFGGTCASSPCTEARGIRLDAVVIKE